MTDTAKGIPNSASVKSLPPNAPCPRSGGSKCLAADDKDAPLALGGAAGLFMHESTKQLREAQHQQIHRRETWSPWRMSLSLALESQRAEFGLGFLIIVNCLFVILDTDYRAESDGVSPTWLSVTTFLLLQVYVVDLVLKLFVYRRRFFDSGLNIFELIVVSIDYLSVILELCGVGIGVSVSVLRVLRLGRLLRFMKVVRIFHELYVMLHLMVSALRAIGWGAALMAIMMTIWSIIAVEILHPLNKDIAENTDAYDGCERCGRAFESVMAANLTFFQTIIAGDSWGQVGVVLIEYYPATAVFLVTVILSMELGLMNLVVTVIVDKAQEAREENMSTQVEEKRKQFEEAKKQMKTMCRVLDEDDSGQLSLDEITSGYNEVQPFRETLMLMDVNEGDLNVVFSIMDEDGSGSVSYDEFVDQLYKMKTQSTHTTIVFIRAYVKEIRSKVAEQLQIMKSEMREQMQAVDCRLMALSEGMDRLLPTRLTPAKRPQSPEVGRTPPAPKSTDQPDTTRQTEPKLVHSASSQLGSCVPDSHPGPRDARQLPEADHTALLYKLHKQVEEQLALEMRNAEILAKVAGCISIGEADPATARMRTLEHPRSAPRHSPASSARPPPTVAVQKPIAKSTWSYISPFPEDGGGCCRAAPLDVVKLS